MTIEASFEAPQEVNRLPINGLLREAETEVGRYDWEGTFSEYMRLLSHSPEVSRLSHKLVYDSIINGGVKESETTGDPMYALFNDNVYGLDEEIERIVQYFASSARRLEIRKRILLLLGPPASGKSSIVALIKEALERFTRTDRGAVYGIKGCPMQEDPLHLIPHNLRGRLLKEYGIHVEGDLCPKCRYMVRVEYNGQVSAVPVNRVVFSEQEAVGIGYYIATNPNPTDASLLVGSVDTTRLEGDRSEVAGKAFRLDGELNVANRGLVEFVEIFKSNKHLLFTLLGLAQEQLIKMERFGSVYADEVIIGHSNEGDFAAFMADPSSEALRDRIIAIQVPYNRKVSDELRIYNAMLQSSGLTNVHVPPLTLPTASTFAVLSRLEPAKKQGVTLINKLLAYDGFPVDGFNQDDVLIEKRQHPNEGMTGLSPRYVMNRLSSAAAAPNVGCISPLLAMDSLWRGLSENISFDGTNTLKYLNFAKETVNEYNQKAIRAVQRAFEERFEQTAAELFGDYLDDVTRSLNGRQLEISQESERSMREMEKHAGVSERDRFKFRQQIQEHFEDLKARNMPYDYSTEPRIRAAVEKRLFPDNKTLKNELNEPSSSSKKAEWRRKRGSIHIRLVQFYGYCSQCAEDTVEYVIHLLKGRPDWKRVFRTSKGDAIDWMWDLNPAHLAGTRHLDGSLNDTDE